MFDTNYTDAAVVEQAMVIISRVLPDLWMPQIDFGISANFDENRRKSVKISH